MIILLQSNKLRTSYTNAGFSLIEVAIALTVIGIVMGTAFPLVTHMLQMGRTKTTIQHQEAIMTALAQYALQHGHLPFPATLNSHGIALDEPIQSSVSDLNGFVPYATLGIAHKYTLDGYQQPIIYALSLMHGEPVNSIQLHNPMPDTSHVGALDNVVFAPENFCYKYQDHDPNLTIQINDHHKSSFFIDSADQGDDFVAVALLSRGEEAMHSNPSQIERINTTHNLEFYDYPISARKDSPHRHILTWASRDLLISHYAQLSCVTVRYNRSYRNTIGSSSG